jgi:hypothetical protein
MSQQKITPQTAHHSTTPAVSPHSTRLLTCGIVAGPLFLLVWALQAFTRDGFDPGRHPLSLLSLGDLGWIQIANFVVTGALLVACSVGMRPVLRPGRGSTWGPVLIGAFGAGFIVAGVFTTDPGAGFPAGAPAGAPDMSWHGALHEIGYAVTILSWTAVCFVLGRRFTDLQERGLSRLCVTSVIAVFVISAWPDLNSLSVRIVIATAIQFGLVAVSATRMRRGLAEPPTPLLVPRSTANGMP